MAGFFDTISNITNDPQFQTGLGLLGQGMGNQSLVNAYTMLQTMKQRQFENEQALQKAALEKQQGARLDAQSKLYEQQVLDQQRRTKMLTDQQTMVQPFIKQMMEQAAGSGQPAPAPQVQPTPQSGMQPPAQMMPTSFTQQQPAGQLAVSPTFSNADKFVSGIEGGFVANDGGKGPTNYGINQRANPDVNVKTLTPDSAAQIRKTRYWDAIGGDNLLPATAMVAYDAAVNQGQQYAKDLIQKTGGDPQLMLYQREQDYKQLAKNPMQAGNLSGWQNRLSQLGQQLKVAAPTPAPVAPAAQAAPSGQLAPHRAMTMAAGAIQAMGENPGAGLATMAGAFKPETHKPGDIIIGPRGEQMQLPNPAQDIQLANEQTRIGLEAQRVQQQGQAQAATQAIQEQKQKLSLAKDTGMVGDTLAKTNLSINAIDELLKHPGLDNVTGRYSKLPEILRKQIDPNGMNAQAALDSVKSQLLLQQLMSMKELSANGSSGFGQLSNVEGEQIRNSLGSLNESQTTEALTKNLRTIRDLLKNTAQRVQSVYKSSWGDQAQEVAPPQTATSGPVTLPGGWKVEKVK